MNISVCTDALYRGVPTAEAIRRTKSSGLSAIEFWSWWDKDLNAIEDALGEHGVTLATFCTRFISLVDPSVRTEYLAGLEATLETAKRFGVTRLISQVGNARSGVTREAQRASLVDGLRACVPPLEKAGVTLLIEPLNLLVDHRGYYLSRSDEAFDVVRDVDSPRVAVIYDIYHQQITEGNLIPTIRENIAHIGHFHAAGHPGRHELDDGEIAYDAVFAAIGTAGYSGFVGLEYFPQRDADTGLRDLARRYSSR